MFPTIQITILDNESTDNSAEIARNLGCTIKTIDTDNIKNIFTFHNIRNELWKTSEADWIIICDMDEYLCMNQRDLDEEEKNGATLIKTQGYNMVADSQSPTLSDITIGEINKGIKDNFYSKTICFNRNFIHSMRYGAGGHECFPVGIRVQYSKKTYPLYHFKYLGFEYLFQNYRINYNRTHDMRKNGMSLHYTNNKHKIREKMEESKKAAIPLPPLSKIDSP
tara:strand:- start:26 stop:694 length:669 start_codon:yes stop_codon:yes gene_type:complete